MNELFDYYEIRILAIRKLSSPTHCHFHPVSDSDGRHFRRITVMSEMIDLELFLFSSID